MRIVVHDYGGYPFTAQLARELADRGHEVLYLYAAGFRVPKASLDGEADRPPTLRMNGVDVGSRYRGTASPRRFLQERRYGTLVAERVIAHKPDVVISANCPLDAQTAIQRAARDCEAAFVFWLQDVYSLAVGRMLARRVPVIGGLIGHRYARLERRLLLASDAVVAITPDFLPVLRSWGVAADRTTVVENWAPLDPDAPLPKRNAWSIEHGLADVLVLLYAGTLGRKHDPRLLLALARGIPDARVVVVADGIGAGWLRENADGVPNLVLLPLQPGDRVSEVLATADVLVAILASDAGAFSVPSKVLTYLTAGRPILAAIPAENLAARTILDAEAGRVMDPADLPAFVAAARRLLGNREEGAAAAGAARDFALRSFGIHRIADRFEQLLRDATLPANGRTAPTAEAADVTRDA